MTLSLISQVTISFAIIIFPVYDSLQPTPTDFAILRLTSHDHARTFLLKLASHQLEFLDKSYMTRTKVLKPSIGEDFVTLTSSSLRRLEVHCTRQTDGSTVKHDDDSCSNRPTKRLGYSAALKKPFSHCHIRVEPEYYT